MVAPRPSTASDEDVSAPRLNSVEDALVERVRAGDGQAFAQLVRPHLPVLFRIAHRACGNAALAEDAVQETLTIAHRGLNRFRAGSSLRTFLIAIAVKRARTLLRSETRRRLREDNAQEPSPQASPAESLAAAQVAERVRDALRTLPKKRQEVAILRLDANLSYLEIAHITGTTEGSARVLVHLAMKELRHKLSDLVNNEGNADAQERS